MGFTIEGVVAALILVSLFIATLGPALYSTLSPPLAGQFNSTSNQSTSQLNGFVFKQVNNTAFCGEASTPCGTNSTGGFSAISATSGSGFAFVIQGFGTLIGSLVNAPIIMANLVGTLLSVVGFPITTNVAIKNELEAFVIFLFIIIGISSYMKYPLRSG